MTVKDALMVLKRNQVESVYVVAGTEHYWRTRWLKRVEEIFFGSDHPLFVSRLEDVTDFGVVELELASRSLFDRKKLVVVERGRWSKKEETIKKYKENPIADTVLVIYEDKESSALKKSLGPDCYIELAPLTGTAFRRFVDDQAKRLSIRWDSNARESFCRRVDGNEYLAINELEKLSLYWKREVKVQDVEAWVHPIKEDDKPWDITDALLRRDGPETFRLIHRHLNQGKAPLFLFILMARQLVQIDRARQAAQNGLTLAQFQEQEGIRGFVAKKIWAARSAWSDTRELKLLLDWAFKIDVAMKTAYGDPDVWLVLWTALWAGHKNTPGGERKGRLSVN